MPHGSEVASPPRSIIHSLVFIAAAVVVAGVLPFIGAAERTDNTVHFTSPHRYMIIVPVRVNGTGPYSFLLDTGATSSAVDPQLSTSLHLAPAQSVRVASWENTTDTRRVLVGSLSLGSVDSGPLSILVLPLSGFKAFDHDVRGVLGQDVLLRTNFLIDNRHHRIQFDDGALLPELAGDRVSITPVRTRSGALEPRLIAVSVQTPLQAEPLHLLLDSGADMVVLQPSFVPPATAARGTKWIADENGRSSAASTLHTVLSVGSTAFSTDAWVGDTGLKILAIDGLLPTGSFDQIYIANRESFVILEPRRIRHGAPRHAEPAARSNATP
jgi:predicted aspartyl protease